MIVASKTVVNIFCNNETEHQAKKKYGSEEWCEANYGQICDEHVANHNKTSSMFFNGTIPNPTSILCTPDGKEITRKKGGISGKELIDMMKEATAKVGAGIGQDEYLFGKGKLKAAADAVGAKKMKDAIEALNAITKAFGKNAAAKPLNDQAQAKLKELNDAGMAIIEAAKADAAADKVEDARKALKDVYANYKGLECSKVAEKEMAALPKAK
ncbi:MAG: hypothetical protein K8T20_14955 [Planctomycetes bacterium]|nr:hypothetical protein [Planctomycetota bacterium]